MEFLDKLKNYLSTVEEPPKKSKEELIDLFIDYVKGLLDIKSSVFIKFTDDKDETKTYGQFDAENNSIVVYTAGRKLGDVLRSLSHEYIHLAQKEAGKVLDGSTGSDDENEANELSGIIMREFGDKYPEVFDTTMDEEVYRDSPPCKWAKEINRGGYTKDDMSVVCNNKQGGNYSNGDKVEYGEGCPYSDNWNEAEALCKTYAKVGLEESVEKLLNEKTMTEKFHTGVSTYNGYKEIYLNPTPSEVREVANHEDNEYGVRGGFGANNDLYIWDAIILHHEMEKKLGKKFFLKFDFAPGEAKLFSSSENQVKADAVKNLDEKIVEERMGEAFPEFKKEYMKFLSEFWLKPLEECNINESINDIWYHGTSHKIEKFSLDFVGNGTDQNGPGIYFSSNEEDAASYSSKSDNNKEKYLYKVKLNFKKIVPVTGRPKKDELIKMIGWAKSEDEEKYNIAVSNWAETEQEAIDEAVKAYMTMPPNEAFESIAADWYKDIPQGFCTSMVALDYDGVIIKRQFMNVKHAVVYNVKIITDKEQI